MRSKNSLFAILLIIGCTFLTSFGQYFIKLGTTYFTSNPLSILNFYLIMGCILYGLGAIVLIIALKYGELSVLYPFIALSFVWVFFMARFMLHEPILFINWIGLVIILLGVSFIGWGADHE